MGNKYRIIEDFQVINMRVLVLNRDYEFGGFNRVLIDGKSYPFSLNSIRNWVSIKSEGNFVGKEVEFIKEDK